MIRETLQRIEEVGWSELGWGRDDGKGPECVMNALRRVSGESSLAFVHSPYASPAGRAYKAILDAGRLVFNSSKDCVGTLNDRRSQDIDDVRLWLNKAAAEAGELPL